MDNKLNPKRNCYHYKCSKCNILVNDGRYLNCQIHKCSFFETKEEYEKRQDEFYKRQYIIYQERMV